MPFVVSFPDRPDTRPPLSEVARWLQDRGEPCEAIVPDERALVLRALPVRVTQGDDGAYTAHLQPTARAPVSRIVALIFDLSTALHADVSLRGVEQTRASLWLELADEQDRQRIVGALVRAEDRGNRDEVLQRLWPQIAALRPGRDLRWDVARARIVEHQAVGDHLSLEAARRLDPDAALGGAIAVPVTDPLHVLAWRWLVDAYPTLAEPDLGSVWPR